jgi:hypothetical protein
MCSATSYVGFFSSNFRSIFGGLSCILPTSSLMSLPTSLLASSNCRPTPCHPSSCVLRLDGSTSYALRTTVLRLDVLRTTLLQSYVLCTVVVHLVVLCPATYLIAFCRSIVLRLGGFRPYIALELCN